MSKEEKKPRMARIKPNNISEFLFVDIRVIRGKKFLFFVLFSLLSAILPPALCFGQVATRTDGVTVFYYDTLHEAFNAAAEVSIDQPDEITLLADLVLDAPLTLDNGVHIRLVPGSGDRTIRRGDGNIEYPVIWINGEGASLTLGKPGMEYELVIDGACLNIPPKEAHAPLVAVMGPDSKLIMYDKVTLQNNINTSNSTTVNYQYGAGVLIFTQRNNVDRQAEFILKGGTIQGNINKTKNPIPFGGGVFVAYGIFTMEGGVIMNNTAGQSGGGFYRGLSGSFKKTGGIIYGSNAPAGYRNTALVGVGIPAAYGHSVAVDYQIQSLSLYREDTVGENDNLTLTSIRGFGTAGKGEKWDSPAKALLRMVLAIALPLLTLIVCFFLIYRKITLKKLMKIAQEAKEAMEAADQSAKVGLATVFANVKLTDREREVGTLLLTKLSIKQIATVMKIAYVTVDFHSKKLYRKMGIQNRAELLVQAKKMSNEE
jgi:DNA-binding CsgD family transcriptional regulator